MWLIHTDEYYPIIGEWVRPRKINNFKKFTLKKKRMLYKVKKCHYFTFANMPNQYHILFSMHTWAVSYKYKF